MDVLTRGSRSIGAVVRDGERGGRRCSCSSIAWALGGRPGSGPSPTRCSSASSSSWVHVDRPAVARPGLTIVLRGGIALLVLGTAFYIGAIRAARLTSAPTCGAAAAGHARCCVGSRGLDGCRVAPRARGARVVCALAARDRARRATFGYRRRSRSRSSSGRSRRRRLLAARDSRSPCLSMPVACRTASSGVPAQRERGAPSGEERDAEDSRATPTGSAPGRRGPTVDRRRPCELARDGCRPSPSFRSAEPEYVMPPTISAPSRPPSRATTGCRAASRSRRGRRGRRAAQAAPMSAVSDRRERERRERARRARPSGPSPRSGPRRRSRRRRRVRRRAPSRHAGGATDSSLWNRLNGLPSLSLQRANQPTCGIGCLSPASPPSSRTFAMSASMSSLPK